VFRIQGDRLYYAEFHYSGSGGNIVAVDLSKGNELWRSPLKALGEISHSSYLNRMTIDANDDVVSIYGNEIPRQTGTLLKTLSRFEPHTVSKESRLYVEILSLLGKFTHAELLRAYLGGDSFAGWALRRIGEDAQESVAGIRKKLGETDRWKLMKLVKPVPRRERGTRLQTHPQVV